MIQPFGLPKELEYSILTPWFASLADFAIELPPLRGGNSMDFAQLLLLLINFVMAGAPSLELLLFVSIIIFLSLPIISGQLKQQHSSVLMTEFDYKVEMPRVGMNHNLIIMMMNDYYYYLILLLLLNKKVHVGRVSTIYQHEHKIQRERPCSYEP